MGFDYISDRLLSGVRARGTRVETPGGSYRAIVLPPTRYMPLATLRMLVELATNGVTVLVHNRLPEDAPGLRDAAEATAYANVLAKLQQNASTENGVRVLQVGKGRFLIGDDLAVLLTRVALRGEPMAASAGLKFVRRTNDTGVFYFVTNRSDNATRAGLTSSQTVRTPSFSIP